MTEFWGIILLYALFPRDAFGTLKECAPISHQLYDLMQPTLLRTVPRSSSCGWRRSRWASAGLGATFSQASPRISPWSIMGEGNRFGENVKRNDLRWSLRVGKPNGPHSSQAII